MRISIPCNFNLRITCRSQFLHFVLIYLVLQVNGADCGTNFTVTDEAWFDVEIRDLYGKGQHYRGRFEIGLFGDTVPMTVYNFVSIANGYEMGKRKLSYKGSMIHRIMRDFLIQMGDITTGDGTGGESVYGLRFNDENFHLSHRSAGWVSMANHGADTNASQFFIILHKARWLDGKHVVFGKVLRGYKVIETIAELDAEQMSGQPKHKIVIVDCGSRKVKKPYELKTTELDSTNDLTFRHSEL